MSEAQREKRILTLGEACCGCGACVARCPVQCLQMCCDPQGFYYPMICSGVCTDCGACDVVCPVLNLPDKDNTEAVFWAKAKEDGLLDKSSSGGLFGILARAVLSKGGIVVGASWGDNCRELRHTAIAHEEQLDSIMRSKYVQSAVDRGLYEAIREALHRKRPVLFCGTSCQVAGIRSYLGKAADSDLFIGIDIICHGVPSPKLWQAWLSHLESLEGEMIRDVNFRSKATGWLSYSVMYAFGANRECESRIRLNKFTNDWYMNAFLKNASLRGSCLSCPFKRRCGSDITLGDYWGIQRQHPEVPVEKGVSAVLCNTWHGKEVLETAKTWMDYGESSFDKVLAGNPSLLKPVMPCSNRSDFLDDLSNDLPVEGLIKKWTFRSSLLQRGRERLRAAGRRLRTKLGSLI